jgi:hypothetical protein
VKGSDEGVGVISEGTGLANGSDLKGLPYTKVVVKGFSMSVYTSVTNTIRWG